MISASDLAQLWLTMPHVIPTKTERAEFAKWVMASYVTLCSSRNVYPYFVSRDVDLAEVMSALSSPLLPGEVRYFPVSRLNNDPNPDLMSPSLNLIFRAIHDVCHHLCNAEATYEGELTVAYHHMKSAPESIRWIIFSEVAGQAAATLTSGEFPLQRIVDLRTVLVF
jgi:hypothetical protein